MAIDPNKMAAFAQQGPKPEADLSKLNPGGGEKGAEGGGGEPSSEDMKEGGQGKFGSLIPLLEEQAEEIEACCDELDPEQLANPEEPFDDENHDIFVESFAELDDALKDALIEAFAEGLKPEEADELATHLEGEGMIEDTERVANYLRHVARAIEDGEIGADEGEMADDADEGGEDESEGEESEEAEAPPEAEA